jgi:hypothetical protein
MKMMMMMMVMESGENDRLLRSEEIEDEMRNEEEKQGEKQ